jgi:hypothetical protein
MVRLTYLSLSPGASSTVSGVVEKMNPKGWAEGVLELATVLVVSRDELEEDVRKAVFESVFASELTLDADEADLAAVVLECGDASSDAR